LILLYFDNAKQVGRRESYNATAFEFTVIVTATHRNDPLRSGLGFRERHHPTSLAVGDPHPEAALLERPLCDRDAAEDGTPRP